MSQQQFYSPYCTIRIPYCTIWDSNCMPFAAIAVLAKINLLSCLLLSLPSFPPLHTTDQVYQLTSKTCGQETRSSKWMAQMSLEPMEKWLSTWSSESWLGANKPSPTVTHSRQWLGQAHRCILRLEQCQLHTHHSHTSQACPSQYYTCVAGSLLYLVPTYKYLQ